MILTAAVLAATVQAAVPRVVQNLVIIRLIQKRLKRRKVEQSDYSSSFVNGYFKKNHSQFNELYGLLFKEHSFLGVIKNEVVK